MAKAPPGGETPPGPPKGAASTEEEEQAARFEAVRSSFRSLLPRVSYEYNQRLQQGRLGAWIGQPPFHAGNIAFLTILGLLILIGLCLMGLFFVAFTDSQFDGLKSVLLALITLMGTILGYIFGRGADKKPE